MANFGAGQVKLPPDFDLQGQNAAAEWKFWRTAFEDYLAATGQHEAADSIKLSILRNMIGIESARIMSTFVVPEDEADKYKHMLSLIQQYVNPRINECFERYNFLKRVQKEGESFEHFLTECRHLVKTCNYNANNPNETNEDKALRDKILMGIRDPVTREALLRIDQLSLEKAIQFCRTSEQSKNQSLMFQADASNEINVVKKQMQKVGVSDRRNKFHRNKPSKREDKFKCRRCQTMHGARECPAFGKKCARCGLLNHFANACKVRNIRSIDQAECSDSENELFVGIVNAKCSKIPSKNVWEEIIMLESKKIKVRLDTGADVSVIPITIFNDINMQFKVRPTEYRLKGFEGSEAKPVGIVNLYCNFKGKEIYEDFVIVKGAKQVLLGGQACINLNLIKRINGISLKPANNADREKFINSNNDVFSGYGRFPGNYNITTASNFETVSHPPTKIPMAIREPLKVELDRLVSRKAIIRVDEIDPRASINRIVIVEKNNGKIRICLDPSDLNKQIIRKPKLVPSIEEICSNLNNKKFFTVFDLAEGYHHLELNEESSWKCCFSTPLGIYRFLVLPYGLSNSQDLFQDEVEKNFGNLRNVQICHDDMIVSGITKEDHDRTVSEVIERARQVGAKFNKDKFQYCQTQVKFMGQMFSENGMQIDPDRIEALCKLDSPKDKVELQRIIGSFNYVRRYIVNMAEIMQPLCNLLKNSVEWHWLPKHQENFDKLKKIISESPALVPFDNKLKIILQCDASKYGLGCCMFQQHDNNTLKLVACASRTMNEHEVSYSQTEKELLSIYYGTKKFHDFIYGQEITVQSDHKPIISIMKKPIHKIGSIRLQRIRLKLLKYILNVVYVPGKDLHFADMLSRSSLKSTGEVDLEMFEMVHLVTKYLPVSKQRRNEFRSETTKDKTLMKIYDYYYKGWPKASAIPVECRPYYSLKDSIYVEAGIIFLDNKIIVPISLQSRMIELLHKGHIGISKTINRARTLFYWPSLSYDIKMHIKQCRVCEKYMPTQRKEPMMLHSVPRLRFNKVGSDILEFGGKSYLVVIDHFSHWIEIVLLKDKTSESIINSFQDIFIRFGYPEWIIADNLPFISVKCKQYYQNKDITITTCSPYYHQGNGLAEKAVSIGKNILKKSLENKTDFRELVMEYNNTPIINLKASPSQILQSRTLKSEIPITYKNLEPKVHTNIYRLLCEQKDIVKLNYDRTARKNPTFFKKGDKVVIKSNRDKVWNKAIIIEKAKEPRSYWVKKENSNKIVRRNNSHIKLSFTKPEYQLLSEPELYPNNTPIHVNKNIVNNNQYHNVVNKSSNIECKLTQNVIEKNNECNRSRSGRTVRPPCRLNL